VTAHTPQEAVRSTLAGGFVSDASDAKTALLTVCPSNWFLDGVSMPCRPPAPRKTPDGCLPLLQSEMSLLYIGAVITVDIDAKANVFAVQHHWPEEDRRDGSDRMRLTPPEVRVMALPPSLNVLDCRPCLAWWGPSTVSEVEASDAFPLCACG
jgi:hypothetical protein